MIILNNMMQSYKKDFKFVSVLMYFSVPLQLSTIKTQKVTKHTHGTNRTFYQLHQV